MKVSLMILLVFIDHSVNTIEIPFSTYSDCNNARVVYEMMPKPVISNFYEKSNSNTPITREMVLHDVSVEKRIDFMTAYCLETNKK